MAMRAKIAKWGNSVGVRFPKPLAQDLGLTPGREVDLRQNGSQVTIETKAVRRIPSFRLEDLLAQIKPGTKSPPLEDWGILETEWPVEDWSDVAPTDAQWAAWKKQAALKPNAGRKRAKSSRRRA
jgi:antitoxin MazE